MSDQPRVAPGDEELCERCHIGVEVSTYAAPGEEPQSLCPYCAAQAWPLEGHAGLDLAQEGQEARARDNLAACMNTLERRMVEHLERILADGGRQDCLPH